MTRKPEGPRILKRAPDTLPEMLEYLNLPVGLATHTDLLAQAGNENLSHEEFLKRLLSVEAAAKFQPEVVLLDIGLPKLNGYEVARKIREQPWGQDMVLVALTGWGQEEDRQKSKEAGFNAHLVKPLEQSVLMKLLAEL